MKDEKSRKEIIKAPCAGKQGDNDADNAESEGRQQGDMAHIDPEDQCQGRVSRTAAINGAMTQVSSSPASLGLVCKTLRIISGSR